VGLDLSVSSTCERGNGSTFVAMSLYDDTWLSSQVKESWNEEARHVLKGSCIHRYYARELCSIVVPYPSPPSQLHQSYQKAVPVNAK
jgi:hypothetical protein